VGIARASPDAFGQRGGTDRRSGVFAAYARLRAHEARAVTETKRARRVRVRRPVSALPADEPAAEVDAPALSSFAEIVPFAIEEVQ
jgi:hypothetical protein